MEIAARRQTGIAEEMAVEVAGFVADPSVQVKRTMLEVLEPRCRAAASPAATLAALVAAQTVFQDQSPGQAALVAQASASMAFFYRLAFAHAAAVPIGASPLPPATVALWEKATAVKEATAAIASGTTPGKGHFRSYRIPLCDVLFSMSYTYIYLILTNLI